MKKTLTGLIYILLGILIGFFGYQEFGSSQNTSNPTSNNYVRFDEILATLELLYYDQDKIDTGVMTENALKAFVDGLHDPYTTYLDSESNSIFQEDLKGEANFEGIGAVISKKDYFILVEEVIKDSPAFKAEIRPLDRIIVIGDKPTKDMTINEAVKEIRGPKGSNAYVIIERISKDQKKEIIEKNVIRNNISVPSVNSKILDNNIGYLEISMVGDETENLLKKELLNLQQQTPKGLILDLRGNGGGYLPTSVEIASHFIKKNKIIVSAKYRQFGEEKFYSRGYQRLDIPIVVLIDSLTASAGEIIALALQEQANAMIIGTQSFGKGSIQTMKSFEDGSSLKYTVGNRYAPSGKSINNTGITPNIEIEFDGELFQSQKIDNQLQKAIEILSNM